MTRSDRCSRCGARLSADAPDTQLCPQCLMKLGLEDLAPTVEAGTPLPEEHPGRIDRYEIVRKLGEGGMGIVYEAAQVEPVRRRVALKLIKLGMDTRQVMVRFEAERQALAMMEHPNVAKVFDAGATEQGRPYFVMEYFPGIPITRYCDEHALTVDQRLDLFTQVCQAIQHAHQKGIIHRDVKPSNVLVSKGDDEPQLKVIDFGVAKATSHSLTEQTLYTRQDVLVGTPQYMSPEQADPTVMDIDTRTDVYSLGVLLYEMLVGVLPFEPPADRRAGLDELCRRIREEEPPKPSTRLGHLPHDRSRSIAERRRTDSRSLINGIRRELDWIAIKSLARDRNRRYESPAALAADIRRYLGHEPVLAGPPSALYRLGKFARRNKVAVTATALVATSLVIGVLLATAGMIRAGRAEKLALAEAANASRQAEAARRVSGFLVDLFQVSDPGESRGNTVTARELLDRGAEKIARQLADEPLTRASLTQTMGRVYQSLGLFDRAEELILDAIGIRERELGSDHPEYADGLDALGWLRQETGKFAEAEKLHERAFAIRGRTSEPDRMQVGWTHYYLATSLARQGQLSEAEAHYERAAAIFADTLGPDDKAISWCLNDLAVITEDRGEWPEAAALYERALDIKEKVLGPDHLDVARTLANFGQLQQKMGNASRAQELIERALAIHERVLGPDHPDTGSMMILASLLYARLGLADEAESVYRRSVELMQSTFGEEFPYLLYNQACYKALVGARDEAIDYLERALGVGYRGTQLKSDPDLASLYGDPEFEAIVERYE